MADKLTREQIEALKESAEQSRNSLGLVLHYSHVISLCDMALSPSPALTAAREALDGNRALPFSRDELGRMVREAWVRWARTQPAPKPSWLLPYDELAEPDKEADRQIGEAVARFTLIGDAAALALLKEQTHG